MHEEPTAYRLPDPGVRALFAEDSRYQAWLDVEAALAQAQAELGIIPPHAAEEITRKARLALLDRQAIRAGLERTGHSLVPLIWELDRICDGDAGGYVHWGATTQNVTQTGQLLLTRRAHDMFLRQLATLLEVLGPLAERAKDMLLPGRTHGQHALPATFGFKERSGSTSCAVTSTASAGARAGSSSPCSAAARARWPPSGRSAWWSRTRWRSAWA
jgi:adenylosuccinate lyase